MRKGWIGFGLMCIACGGGGLPVPTEPPDVPAVEVPEVHVPPEVPTKEPEAPVVPAPPPGSAPTAPVEVTGCGTTEPRHDALCAAVEAVLVENREVAMVDEWLGGRVDCPCPVEHSRKKLGASIPIVKDFINDKYKTWVEGETPLYRAAVHDRKDLATRLLDGGALVDAPSEGRTPLTGAAAADNRAMVDFLLGRGASAGRVDLAAVREIALVEKLVGYGAPAATIDVTFAVDADGTDTLKRVLALGADPDHVDGYRITWVDDLQKTTMLLDAGLDPDTTAFQGQSLLTSFAGEGDVPHVELLLARGADPNHVSDPFEVTPLQAAREGDHAKIVELLVARGAR